MANTPTITNIELAAFEELAKSGKIDRAWFDEYVTTRAKSRKKVYGFALHFISEGKTYVLRTQRGHLRRFSNVCYAINFVRKHKIPSVKFNFCEFKYQFLN